MSECKHEFKIFQVPSLKISAELPLTIILCRFCGESEKVVNRDKEIAGHIRHNKLLFDANVNVIKGRDAAREQIEDLLIKNADLWTQVAELTAKLTKQYNERIEAEVREAGHRKVLEEASNRLSKAYEIMNWFASGESMKEYRRIEPADILIEVYQVLAPLVAEINQVLAGAGEQSNSMPTVTKYQNFKAKDGQRIKCGYCGQLFVSVGDTEEYEHNWVKCKAAGEGKV